MLPKLDRVVQSPDSQGLQRPELCEPTSSGGRVLLS